MEGQAHIETEHQADTPSGHTFHWGWWLGIFLVIYVLAVGPANRLASRNPALTPALQAIYFPVRVAYETCPFIRPPLDWYVRLWP